MLTNRAKERKRKRERKCEEHVKELRFLYNNLVLVTQIF